MRRVLALGGLVAVLLTACGGDDAPDERRFEQDGAPFAFAYPPDLVTIQPRLRETERSAPTFKTSVGTDEANYVHVATYDTKVPVDLANPESQNTVDRAAQFLAKNTGWSSARASRPSWGRWTRSSTRWRRSTPGARAA